MTIERQGRLTVLVESMPRNARTHDVRLNWRRAAVFVTVLAIAGTPTIAVAQDGSSERDQYAGRQRLEGLYVRPDETRFNFVGQRETLEQPDPDPGEPIGLLTAVSKLAGKL